MRIDEFEFQDRNGNEIEPTKNQLVVYIKSLHKQVAEIQNRLKEKEKRLKQIDNWKMNYGYTNYDDIYTLEDLQSRAFQSEDDTQIIDELLDYFNISDENKILPVIKQQLKQSQNQVAIDELERFKNYIFTRIYLTANGDEEKINTYVDLKIKNLKGE